jgi:hypothetical protein
MLAKAEIDLSIAELGSGVEDEGYARHTHCVAVAPCEIGRLPLSSLQLLGGLLAFKLFLQRLAHSLCELSHTEVFIAQPRRYLFQALSVEVR